MSASFDSTQGLWDSSVLCLWVVCYFYLYLHGNVIIYFFKFSCWWPFYIVSSLGFLYLKLLWAFFVQILWWMYTVISLRYMQWCVGKCLTIRSLAKIALICKHLYTEFQTTVANFKLPGGYALGRDVSNQLSGICRHQSENSAGYIDSGVEFWDQRRGIHLVSLSKVIVPFSIPISNVQQFQLPHILSDTGPVRICLIFSSFWWVCTNNSFIFMCVSMMPEVQHLCLGSITMWLPSTPKCLFKPVAPFGIGLFCLFFINL